MCAKKNKTKKLYINIYLDCKENMMEMIMLFLYQLLTNDRLTS